MKYVTSYMAIHEHQTLCCSNDIQENKAAAEQHAIKNPRSKGVYIVAETVEFTNGGFAPILNSNTVKGKKRGKSIDWNKEI